MLRTLLAEDATRAKGANWGRPYLYATDLCNVRCYIPNFLDINVVLV